MIHPAARGVPIVAISDSTLSPLAKNSRVLFAVPEHEYTFSRSLAAPMCLAQALTIAHAWRLQTEADRPLARRDRHARYLDEKHAKRSPNGI
jgi:DNA-binding MurR/RpiR family transcriptional regulator